MAYSQAVTDQFGQFRTRLSALRRKRNYLRESYRQLEDTMTAEVMRQSENFVLLCASQGHTYPDGSCAFDQTTIMAKCLICGENKVVTIEMVHAYREQQRREVESCAVR